jgi:ankyrin repeat protein
VNKYSELSQDELNDLLHGALYRRARYLNKPDQKGLNLKWGAIMKLLQAGANFKSKDRNGVTALDYAFQRGWVDVALEGLKAPNKKAAKKGGKK